MFRARAFEEFEERGRWLRARTVILCLAVAALTLVASAFAAGGGGKASVQPSDWWSPAQVSGASTTGATSWQDCLSGGQTTTAGPSVGNCMNVAFQTSYWDPTNGTGPWLQLQCFRAGSDYQYEGQLSGTLILADSRAGFPGGWGYGVPFVLSGTAWHLGPANCTLAVGHKSKSGKFMTDASTKFYVSG